MFGKFEIILIGTSICKTDFCYLPDIMNNVKIYTMELDLDYGITFKDECNYEHASSNKIIVSDLIINDLKNHIKSEIKEGVNWGEDLPF